MVQILPQKRNIGSDIGQAFASGFQSSLQDSMQENRQQRALKSKMKMQKEQQQEQSALEKSLLQKESDEFSQQMDQLTQTDDWKNASLGDQVTALSKLSTKYPEQIKNLIKSKTDIEKERLKQAGKAPPGGLSAQPITPEISEKIGSVLKFNQGADADELKFAMDNAGIPPTNSNQYVENRRRKEETKAKTEESHLSEGRKETLDLRKNIAAKADSARKGIENKKRLLDLVNSGKIDDPTFATLASSLPLNLGKRMLSNETVEYKAGLVDEFGDLRNIFSGQTRVKEIELLEEKIADIYLNDEQKKTILKSRINALQADLIKEEAAGQVEEKYPGIGALQFTKKVNELAKPKLEALFNNILDEQKAVIRQAENRKMIPLDPKNPEDFQIMKEIKIEAGGDANAALKLAKKKGYKFL